MRRIVRGIVWSLAFITLVAAALLYAGNALHWERDSPYEQIASWGTHGTEPGRFNEPTGIAVGEGNLYVADARNARIQVFSKQGDFQYSFGEEVLGRPMNLAIADDRLYVADYFQDVIHVFTLDGTRRQAVSAKDGFDSPGGVAVHGDGTLVIADTYNHRVVHIDPADGTVLRVWGTPDEPGRRAGQFRYPTDVALAGDGGFYVADGYNHRIQKFNAEGHYGRRWGGPFALGLPGSLNGWFATATSITVAANGERVLVADYFNQRVQVFTDAGRFLTVFGRVVDGPLPGPIAVAVDETGDAFIASFGGHRVEHWSRDHGN